jgi:inorganic pyrophosphatase
MTTRQKCVLFVSILTFIFLQACGSTKDYYSIPARVSEHTFNAVIEIPAGTNTKYEYSPSQNEFVIDIENGRERVIDFLPYPGNYGFIPSTLSKSDEGGDGDALDVFVLSESVTTGTVVEIVPIALLKLIDDGEMDFKVIGIPLEERNRIIKATTYAELTENYPRLLLIISEWFLNYNKNDTSTIEGWEDEKEAIREIKKHIKLPWGKPTRY